MVTGQTEIRDAIHVFIRLSPEEREVVDSRPVQRLRYIHQLAMTYLVYPGATHRRFDHSLGVMELATRVYDVVTNPVNILRDSVRNFVPDIKEPEHAHWRKVLRMAALCHDIGHLPFSHAAEKELLPEGWSHERLTAEIINSDEMKALWDKLEIESADIAKLALGPDEYKKYSGEDLSTWEAILADIIVGDAFGVDRMDYLLRDSHHIGVVYGSFDHYRLIDTMRILPQEHQNSQEPTLGTEHGGLHAAEALLLARYFMYVQVYFHWARRIYDVHLKDFLKAWLEGGRFSTEIDAHLRLTDNEVTVALSAAARDPDLPGHDPARRIVKRQHYKLLYNRMPDDIAKNPQAAEAIFRAACKEFGADSVRLDLYKQKGNPYVFPVLAKDGRISSSLAMSEPLEKMPLVATDFVFIDPDCRDRAMAWLEKNREGIITKREKEDL